MRASACLVLALLVVAGCRTNKDPQLTPLRALGPALKPAPVWAVPADWDTLPPLAFEALALEALPADRATPLSGTDLAMLAEALDRMDESSVRAAVLLGRSRTDEAATVLWNRLQKRVEGPSRFSDAGDVTAAAALARFPRPERFWRLVRLADGSGRQVHPDLEVRVECACTALHAGIDQVIPFLLEVLRIDTWEGQSDARDFEPSETTAWARGRAALALSQRAGVPLTYHPDAPIADRERETRRLADLLASAIANATEVDYRARR